MAGPFAVVVAGIATIWIALSNADSLVAEDYYRQGLGINRVIDRERAAARRGIAARLAPGERELALQLSGDAGAPAAVFAGFAHATRAGFDVRLRLARQPDGSYRGAMPALTPGRWRVTVEDPQSTWRLAGTWTGAGAPFTVPAIAQER